MELILIGYFRRADPELSVGRCDCFVGNVVFDRESLGVVDGVILCCFHSGKYVWMM